MNSVDFCAIYQPPAVNSLVVTQSQESGGMMKKKRDWEEEEKKTEGRQKARQRWYQPALLPARAPVSIAQAFVLDNGVRYIPPCYSARAVVAAFCGGGTCQNVAWICIIPNPDMLLLHTAVAQAAAPAYLLNYSSCPTSGKYRGAAVAAAAWWWWWRGVAAPR